MECQVDNETFLTGFAKSDNFFAFLIRGGGKSARTVSMILLAAVGIFESLRQLENNHCQCGRHRRKIQRKLVLSWNRLAWVELNEISKWPENAGWSFRVRQ